VKTSPAAVQIRPATEIDKPALREIFLSSRQRFFTWLEAGCMQLEDFDAATADEPILVAVLENQIVGFISWWPPNNFVHNLFAAPTFTRRGIGRKLLAACLAEIGRPATLKCVKLNELALAFYQRLGWRVAGEGASADGGYYLLQLD
jgi:GNAT superfamily N-acetyltransferase